MLLTRSSDFTMASSIGHAVCATGNAVGALAGAAATAVTLGQSDTTRQYMTDCKKGVVQHTKAAVRNEPNVKAFRQNLDNSTALYRGPR